MAAIFRLQSKDVSWYLCVAINNPVSALSQAFICVPIHAVTLVVSVNLQYWYVRLLMNCRPFFQPIFFKGSKQASKQAPRYECRCWHRRADERQDEDGKRMAHSSLPTQVNLPKPGRTIYFSWWQNDRWVVRSLKRVKRANEQVKKKMMLEWGKQWCSRH